MSDRPKGFYVHIHNKIRTLVAVFTSLSLIFATCSPTAAIATDGGNDPSNDAGHYTLGEVGGYLAGELSTTKNVYSQRRFTDPNGHGFAAEEANNFIDRLHGLDARVIGSDNMKNGPDRKIVNKDGTYTFIQDKYHASAKNSVEDAFGSENGMYRYLVDGKPMELEVPSDQFDEAVELMKEKIKNGKVPGITDPIEAETLVRKGRITYKQAKNLTKAGNLTSLKYDAANGAITAKSVFGISFTIDLAFQAANGVPLDEAIGNSAKSAAFVGSAVFCSEVVSNQLMKSGFKNAMSPTAERIAELMGEDACKTLVELAGGASSITGKNLTKEAAKIISSKLAFNAIFTIVISMPDAIDLYQGRMSKE